MKERKYRKDWVNETRTDPETGKEKRVAVYRGAWYRWGEGAPEKRTAVWAACGLCAVFFLLLIGYFLADFPGATTLYVFLPAAIALFPWVYWAMGAFTLWRAQEKMTRLQREAGPGRVLRSCAGCGALAFAAALCDVYFLVFGGAPGREAAGLMLLAAAAAAALFSARLFHRAYRLIEEEEVSGP